MSRMPIRPLGAALAMLFVSACAQNVGDINRVQPNYVRKADLLDGQWYIRNTVVGASANTGFTFTGETGQLEKIVWEIQEGNLVGYRSHPYILGLEDSRLDESSTPSGTTARICKEGVCVGGQKYYGAPIVAYPIKKHFDIQRGYNPTTGELTNVISENASDRPWNEREYIRVNWSAQIMGKELGLRWGTFGNPTGGASFSAWIQANEPNTSPEDWPVFEFTEGQDGEQELRYFDFTGRYYAKPDSLMLAGWGEVPYCLLSPRYDCTSQEIKMRTSIAKVDRDATLDYEPLEFGNEEMSKFGYFRTERLSYDRRFGYTEAKRLLLANRFDIWENTYDRGADGKGPITVNADGSIANQVLPFEQRTPKPIVYYVSAQHRMGPQAVYDQYYSESKILERNWDFAFRRAVAAAQGKGDLSREQIMQQVPQMLFVCNNPVRKGDPKACGKEGFAPRLGDLRHSFLYTITEPTPNGLLGYGPSSADPETGEIISANANTYTGAVDTSAQQLMDMIDLLSEETSTADFISGRYVQDYMLRNSSYANAQRLAESGGALMSTDQGIQQTGQPTAGTFKRSTAKTREILAGIQAAGLDANSGITPASQAERLRQHPSLESALVDGVEASHDVLERLPAPLAAAARQDANLMAEARRMVALQPTQILELEKRAVDDLSRNNVYMADFFNDRLWGYAFQEHNRRSSRINALLGEGKSPAEARIIADDELRERLQRHVWRATSEHEFGHTVGLRHNFQGTYDSINYFDRYWELRKSTLTVQQGAQQRVPMLPGDLKAVANGSAEQIELGMHDHEYSSIMDYHGTVNGDFQGIGRYDEAAILFAYSGGTKPGYVEVFEGARASSRSFPASDGTTLTLRGAAVDLPLVNSQQVHPGVPNFTERFHYSTVPLRFGDGATINAVIDDGIAKLKDRRLVKWSELAPKYEEARRLLRQNSNADITALNLPLEVPYMFCTDDHVGYVLSCHRFDQGPDYLEMTQAWLQAYWSGYYFRNFKRDRFGFSANGAFNSAYTTFDNAAMVYKNYVHALYNEQSGDRQTFANYSTGPLGYDAPMQATWFMGSVDGLNDLFKVMQAPPAGYFALVRGDTDGDFFNSPGELYWDDVTQGDEFDLLTPEGEQAWQDYYGTVSQGWRRLNRGEGRKMYSRYDFKSGFGFQYRMVEAGHYNDQQGAMFASAINPYVEVLDGDIQADSRRYAVPYSLLFKDELEHVFGNLWSQAEHELRPTFFKPTGINPLTQEPLEPRISWRNFIRAEKFTDGFVYPPVEDVSSDAQAYPVNIESTWTARFYALYLGMALFPINYDYDYAKKNQVVKVGSGESFTVAPGYKAVEVDDFTTGHRFIALQQVDGAGNPVGAVTPAVRMVEFAKFYKSIVDDPTIALNPDEHENEAALEETRQLYTEQFRDAVRDLDLMRGFYSIFGKAF